MCAWLTSVLQLVFVHTFTCAGMYKQWNTLTFIHGYNNLLYTAVNKTMIKFNKKYLQINLILRTVWALSKDWNNDVCTLYRLTCRSGEKLFGVQLWKPCTVQIRDKSVWLHLCHSALLLTQQWMTDSQQQLEAEGILWACWIICVKKTKVFLLALKACTVLWNVKGIGKLLTCTVVTQKVEFLSVGNIARFIQTERAESWRGQEWVKEWPRTLNVWHPYNDWFDYLLVCANAQCLEIQSVTAV